MNFGFEEFVMAGFVSSLSGAFVRDETGTKLNKCEYALLFRKNVNFSFEDFVMADFISSLFGTFVPYDTVCQELLRQEWKKNFKTGFIIELLLADTV